jgi:hypothetical protein
MVSLGQAENANSVVAVNHLAPYFRFSCEVTFEAAKVLSRITASANRLREVDGVGGACQCAAHAFKRLQRHQRRWP